MLLKQHVLPYILTTDWLGVKAVKVILMNLPAAELLLPFDGQQEIINGSSLPSEGSTGELPNADIATTAGSRLIEIAAVVALGSE